MQTHMARAKKLKMAQPVGEGVRILDTAEPAISSYTNEISRRLKPEDLGAWGRLLQHIGDTAAEARLDFSVRMPARARDLRINLAPIEQLNAAGRALESLEDELDAILAKPITGKLSDLDLTFEGLFTARQKAAVRVYAQFSSSGLPVSRREIGTYLEQIPGVPPYSAHTPGAPAQTLITLGRFNSALPGRLIAEMVNPHIEGLPNVGEIVPVGSIENVSLARMMNRVIRPDFGVT